MPPTRPPGKRGPYRTRGRAASTIQRAWRGRVRRGRNTGRVNKIGSSVRGKPNTIMTQRTLDFGVVDLTHNMKEWNATTPFNSCAQFNFPNFDITMLPDWREYSALFGRYKLKALEIRLIPVYTYNQVNVLAATAPVTPQNANCNLLITRMSLKYDVSPNENRFNNTYGQQDVQEMDQWVKKKTIVIQPSAFKGFKCYTRAPRQVEQVMKDITATPQTFTNVNVAGKWNDFDSGAVSYIANDCVYVRNADINVSLPPLVLKYRVIYKAYIALSGFQ